MAGSGDGGKRRRRLGLKAEVGGPCPVCGAEIKNIYAKRGANGKIYYYAYHTGGRQCYLGPDVYDYVTRTHKYP